MVTIISYDIVLYVCVVPTKTNIPVLFHYPKHKGWFSHIRHHFEIRVLYPFSSKIILLNQVSGFVEIVSKLKHDVLNHYDGSFQYSNESLDIIFTELHITHNIDVTTEGNKYE